MPSPPPNLTRRRFNERLATAAFGLCALVCAGLVLTMVGVFVWQSVVYLQLPDIPGLPGTELAGGGGWRLLNGTLLTAIVALTIALPSGLLAALYLTEFSPPKVRLYLKGGLEILAAIPPIVWAYVAVSALSIGVSNGAPSALAAGAVLGLMILPLTATLIEDAIFAVPRPLLEGAVALGATRVQALLRVVLPTAAPGIAAAVLLSMSRAVAETVILALAAGDEMRFTIDPRVAVDTVTGFILRASTATEADPARWHAAFMAGLLLFACTGLLHVLAGRLLRRRSR